MNFPNLIISCHALERFKERWVKFAKKPITDNLKLKILKIMSESIEIKKNPISNVIAIINHGKRARYFKKDDLIFVTDENLKILITIECYNKNKCFWIISEKRKKKKTVSHKFIRDLPSRISWK